MFNLEEILSEGFRLHGVDKMNIKNKVKKMLTSLKKSVFYTVEYYENLYTWCLDKLKLDLNDYKIDFFNLMFQNILIENKLFNTPLDNGKIIDNIIDEIKIPSDLVHDLNLFKLCDSLDSSKDYYINVRNNFNYDLQIINGFMSLLNKINFRVYSHIFKTNNFIDLYEKIARKNILAILNYLKKN